MLTTQLQNEKCAKICKCNMKYTELVETRAEQDAEKERGRKNEWEKKMAITNVSIKTFCTDAAK